MNDGKNQPSEVNPYSSPVQIGANGPEQATSSGEMAANSNRRPLGVVLAAVWHLLLTLWSIPPVVRMTVGFSQRASQYGVGVALWTLLPAVAAVILLFWASINLVRGKTAAWWFTVFYVVFGVMYYASGLLVFLIWPNSVLGQRVAVPGVILMGIIYIGVGAYLLRRKVVAYFRLTHINRFAAVGVLAAANLLLAVIWIVVFATFFLGHQGVDPRILLDRRVCPGVTEHMGQVDHGDSRPSYRDTAPFVDVVAYQ
jgi:hypothetical protein